MQQWSPHTHTHPHQPAQQRMHPDMMIPSMYQNNSNDNGFPFHIPMSNPLPPSPVSSVLLSSPSSSCADEPNPSNNHRMSNPGMSLNC
jgi:hypothetical protein